ncbi:DUF4139 domain-containing protein [bacterium]|nr:DUF4139 domain-containing protein [bacterium]
MSRHTSMKTCFALATVALISAAASLCAAGQSETSAQTVGARRSQSLTIYQRNMALVNEEREVQARKGSFGLLWPGVSNQIIAGSVRAAAGEGLHLLEQNYQGQNLDVQSLLESYLGREITLERLDKRTGTVESRNGVLLSLNGGRIVKFGERVEIDPEGSVVLPGVPDDLTAGPRLSWLAEGKKEGASVLSLSYLTRGLGWSCDYVLSLDARGERGALTGWASLDNNTGLEFKDCGLTLVAGEVNMQSPAAPPQPKMMRAMLSAAGAAQENAMDEGFAPAEASGDYYRYDLGRKVSLGRFDTRQIELLSVPALTVKTVYRLAGDQRYYFGPTPESQKNLRPQLFLEWTNGGSNYAGQPLPAGMVRVYRDSGTGGAIFMGEDRIVATPREEKVSISAGYAFDITAQRRQIEFRRLSDRLRQVTVEVRLANRKDTAVTVQVEESLPGDWKITEHSHPFEKLDSGSVRFSPTVAAGAEVVLTYTAQLL